MNKTLARIALVATLAISAMGLSACGTDNNDCAHAASSTTVTATTAMFPSKGLGHVTSHGSASRSASRGFRWFWMGHDNDEKCKTPAPATKS